MQHVYYKALDFETRLWKKAEEEMPIDPNDKDRWKTYGKILDKLKSETYYENSQELRKILKPLIKPNQPVPSETSATNTAGGGSFSISINVEVISVLYSLLKAHFDDSQHVDLFNRLKGLEDSKSKLLFLEDGNKLAFTFRQLYDRQIITRCNKAELEGWILRNFQYKGPKSKGQIKDFTEGYLNDIISTDQKGCANPIINIKMIDGAFKIEPAERETRRSSKM